MGKDDVWRSSYLTLILSYFCLILSYFYLVSSYLIVKSDVKVNMPRWTDDGFSLVRPAADIKRSFS